MTTTDTVLAVKPLVWEGDKAQSPIGVYSVTRTPDGYASSFEWEEIAHTGYNAVGASYGARRAAQDHCQADYERRILSAIALPAGGEVEPVAAEFAVQLRPMDSSPLGHEAMEPAAIEIHEGSWAVVVGTNGKPVGWFDAHATFAHRIYRNSLLTAPNPAPSVAAPTEIRDLLHDLHSIIVVAKGEWTKQSAWSDWDQSVYERLLSVQAALANLTPNQGGEVEPVALTVLDPADWEPCTPSYLERGGSCSAPRVWNAAEQNHWHPRLATPNPAPSGEAGLTRYGLQKLVGGVTLLPVVRDDGEWVKFDDVQALVDSLCVPRPAPSGEAVPVAPEGWVLVPSDPNATMSVEGAKHIGGGSAFDQGERYDMAAEIYRAMLAAAPPSQMPNGPGISAGPVSSSEKSAQRQQQKEA